MMIQAVLSNPSHPEYGVATIPFPIPRDQYAHCMEMLEALEIGDALKADCKVEKIDSFYSVLKRTEMLTVNMEELNYLAKRLESFDTGEAAQFQAMAHKLELFELKDLINLTFCCQQATVITDFSDLAAIGRDHYMNLHGGSASVDELNALDGEETARRLIESGGGTITPYGVVYDSGMKLEQVYDGRFFPCYYYEPNAITVAVTSKAEPEDTEHITWLFLPMVQEEIDRALLRGGITDPSEIRLSLEDSWLPHEVLDLLDMDHVDISELNALVQALDEFSDMSIRKYNSMNGWPAGTPIPNTVFEVYNARTNRLVDTIKTDKNGLAVSKPLPLARYKIVESKAAEFYGLDKTPIEVEIEHAGQIVKVSMTNKSLYTNVSIKKTGYVEVMPGQLIRYNFTGIANNSTTALESFYWRDTLPVKAVRLEKIYTGTWNTPGNYKIVYRTNLSGDTWRTLADNLSTSKNYVLDASPAALGLAANEYVTEFMAAFGIVPSNFRQVEAPRVDCKVLSKLTGGTQFVNTSDAGGVYNGQWIMATSRWVTRVYAPSKPLPRTGY